MFKFLFWAIIACIAIAFVVEYWMWIILALAILVGIYIFCRKKGYIKKFEALLPKGHASNFKTLPQKRTLTEEEFRAVGVNYYEKNICKLACLNPDWKKNAAQIIEAGKAGKRIYKTSYVNRPVKLIHEPDNPHDSNAVAVIIAGEKVGYISREENVKVKDILKKREIISLSAFIGGGEYKVITEGEEMIQDRNGINVTVYVKYI